MAQKNKMFHCELHINEILLALYLFCEFVFQYSVISRLMLIVFVGSVFLLNRKRKFPWAPFITGYLLLIVWSFCGILTGQVASRSLSTDYTVTCILCLLFLIALTRLMNTFPTFVDFCFALERSIFLPCLYCLVWGIGVVQTGQRLSNIVNANALAALASYASIIVCYSAFANHRLTFSKAAHFLLYMAVILLSGSRTGFILLFIGFYIIIAFRNPRKVIRYTIIFVGVLAVSLYLILNVKLLYDIVGFRMEALLLYMRGMKFEEASLASRSDYIALGWRESQNSLFWGHGMHAFSLLSRSYGAYSHNNYIELIYSLGIPGLVFFYFPMLRVLFALIKSVMIRRKEAVLMLAICIAFLIGEYTRVTYFTRVSLIIPVMCSYYSNKLNG